MQRNSSVAGKKVLAADDMEEYREFLEEVLGSCGLEVVTVSDGQKCLDRIAEELPDVLILDVMMPVVHGLEVLRRLRSSPRTRDLPVILWSAKDYRPELRTASDLGVQGYLIKPVHPDNVVSTVTAILRDEALRSRKVAPEAPRESPLALGEPYRPPRVQGDLTVRFWGTRGSVPVSGPSYIVHGGNTSCLEVRAGEHLIILDAGTGIRALGVELARSIPREIHLFISHTHWDHIQGFPFFAPAYLRGVPLHIYGAAGFGIDLESIFRGQLHQDYFPIQFEDMRADITFHSLGEAPIVIGDTTVRWQYSHHPGATVAYRIERAGKLLVYAGDNEFVKGYIGDPAALGREDPVVVPYLPFLDFVSGADVLIHEAQYLDEEYPAKVGWGHTSLSNACRLVVLAGARRWIVTHHDPMHTDEQLAGKLLQTRAILDALGHPLTVEHASDGLITIL